MEGLVAAAVGGVVQTPGDDFEVVDGGTKSTLQWTGKGWRISPWLRAMFLS